jgi:hypothetical protein
VVIAGRDGPLDHTVEHAYVDPKETEEQKPNLLVQLANMTPE